MKRSMVRQRDDQSRTAPYRTGSLSFEVIPNLLPWPWGYMCHRRSRLAREEVSSALLE